MSIEPYKESRQKVCQILCLNFKQLKLKQDNLHFFRIRQVDLFSIISQLSDVDLFIFFKSIPEIVDIFTPHVGDKNVLNLI